MSQKRIIIFIVSLIIGLLACTSEIDEKKKSGPIIMPVNPNGDSELALLMRDMFEEGMVTKEKVKKGEIHEFLLDLEKIHTAEATEPEKAASPEYKVYGLSYLRAVEAFKNAHEEDLENAYTNMVDACMNCHRALCPGPMVRIKKMYL